MANLPFQNHKFTYGKYDNSHSKFNGWFLGDFLEKDNPAKTAQIEVLYREIEKGYIDPAHCHPHKIELILLLEGKAEFTINDKKIILNSSEFIFIEKNNVITAEFLEKSKIFALHSPSLPKDKIVI